jgi:DNA replication protein DnaC
MREARREAAGTCPERRRRDAESRRRAIASVKSKGCVTERPLFENFRKTSLGGGRGCEGPAAQDQTTEESTMNLEAVRKQLKRLKLSTAARAMEEVLGRYQQAVDLAWVSELLERELDARQERALQRRIQRADFPEVTTLEAFDWKFNTKIDRAKVEDLARLEFVRDNRIGLFLGAAGLGKTQLALAIGVLAAKGGYRVFCASVKKLTQLIQVAKLKNTLDVLFKKILSSKLWIIDDWGVVSMNREIAEEVFDLFDRRKYSSAMLLTSNRDVEE